MQVVSFPEKQKINPLDQQHKRLAIQIAAQLPEEPAEALLVLEATVMLVKTFLAPSGL